MADDVDRLREILVGGGKYLEEEFAALIAGWDRRGPLLQHLVAARVLDGVGARTVETVLKGYVRLPRGVLLALFAPPPWTGSKSQERLGMSEEPSEPEAPPARPRTPSREEVRAAVSAALASAEAKERAQASDAVKELSEGSGLKGQVGEASGAWPVAPGRPERSGPQRQAGEASGAWPVAPGRPERSGPERAAARRSERTGPHRQVRADASGEWRGGEGVRTLEELVAIAGPLDAGAVARIGKDLAWDLWATGGHGEVRAARVLVAGTGPALGARLAGSRRGGDVREDMRALGATLFYAATGREPPRERGLAAQQLAQLPGFASAVAKVIAGLLRAPADTRPEAWESVIAALATALPTES